MEVYELLLNRQNQTKNLSNRWVSTPPRCPQIPRHNMCLHGGLYAHIYTHIPIYTQLWSFFTVILDSMCVYVHPCGVHTKITARGTMREPDKIQTLIKNTIKYIYKILCTATHYIYIYIYIYIYNFGATYFSDTSINIST